MGELKYKYAFDEKGNILCVSKDVKLKKTLSLEVKVEKDWRKKENLLKNFIKKL